VLLVAFPLVNAPNCHLPLVIASVVQGDTVNCKTSYSYRWLSADSGTRNIGSLCITCSLLCNKKNVIVASQLNDVADAQFTVE